MMDGRRRERGARGGAPGTHTAAPGRRWRGERPRVAVVRAASWECAVGCAVAEERERVECRSLVWGSDVPRSQALGHDG